MIGDKVQAQYYGRRTDGIDLYRYAVPNIRISPKPIGESIAEDEEKYWEKPKYKILQHPTEQNYGCAIDIENSGFTYTETDIPIEGDISYDTEQAQKAEAFDYLTGRNENNE